MMMMMMMMMMMIIIIIIISQSYHETADLHASGLQYRCAQCYISTLFIIFLTLYWVVANGMLTGIPRPEHFSSV